MPKKMHGYVYQMMLIEVYKLSFDICAYLTLIAQYPSKLFACY